MIHKAYKKGEVAKRYYLKRKNKEYSNKLAYDLLTKDPNVNYQVLHEVILQIFEEQKKLF
jgi:uncharacterized membrane-anchored protein